MAIHRNAATISMVSLEHYTELDRFTRNFADVDKRVREQQRLKKMEVMDSRRRLNMYKEMVHQEHEDIEAKKYF